jgi:hypothetical protein
MEGINEQQDFICRVMGRCLHGERINREVGDLMGAEAGPAGPDRKFSYVRYDHRFGGTELDAARKAYGPITLNNLRTVPYLGELGKEYARQNVKIDHLL